MKIVTLRAPTRRQPGLYRLYWELGRVNGRRRQQTRRFTGTEKEAQLAWLEEEARLEARGVRFTEARTLTVADLLVRFLDEGVADRRATTRHNYAYIARVYLAPPLGSVRLDRLTTEQVEAAVRDWMTRPRAGRADAPPVSRRTVRLALQVLKEALDAGVRWRWVGQNVARPVEGPPAAARGATWWTPDQMAQFLAVTADDPIYGSLYRVACLTGLRQGELLGLRWVDVEWDGPALHVQQQRNRFGETAAPKSARGRRRIPIDAATADALRTTRAAQDRDRARLGADYQDHGLVWQTAIGTPLSPRNLSRRWYRDRTRAGLPPIRFHDLRHSHASALAAAHMDIRQLADRLGHAQVAFTIQTYVHARSEDQRADVERLAAAMTGLAPHDGDLLGTAPGPHPPVGQQEKPR
jgi:integrase